MSNPRNAVERAVRNTATPGNLHCRSQLFSRYGYRRVFLEDIANKTGMSRSGIYNYFRNKEEILKTVVEEIGFVSHQRAEAAAQSNAPLVIRLQNIFDAKMVEPYAELHGPPMVKR